MSTATNSQNLLKDTTQGILNQSFDPDFKVLANEMLGFDGSNMARLKVNSDGSLQSDTITWTYASVTCSSLAATFKSVIAYTLQASVTNFAVTGINLSNLKSDRKLVTAVTNFTLTGINALISRGYKLTTAVTAFTLTGIDAIITYGQAATHYTLTTLVTAFSITGIDTGLKADRKLPTSNTTFTLTGIDTGLQVARKIITAVTEFTITGIDANFLRTYVVKTAVTAFAVTGKTANLIYSGATSVINYIFNISSGKISKKLNNNYSIDL